MRWVLGFVFGIIGAVSGILYFGDPRFGGPLGREITAYAICLGIVMHAPIGFFLGSLVDQLLSKSKRKPAKAITSFAPQICGSPCSLCGTRLMLSSDGRWCQHCRKVFHNTCWTTDVCPNCHQPESLIEATFG